MKDLSSAMQDAGFSISDTPPVQETSQQNVEQTEIPVEQAAPPVEEQSAQPETQPSPEPQLVDEPPVAAPETVPVAEQEVVQQENDFSEEDVDSEVLRYMSERLGIELQSFDSIQERFNAAPTEIDERVAAINNFVRETGRSPEDWYSYQRLNTSEMDDMTAVKNDMRMKHSNLNSEEIDMLIGNKYKLDPDVNTEQDVKMSQLQLKMDAEQARRDIEDIRSKYEAPEVSSVEPESFITDEWVSTMRSEVQDLDGLVFGLPNGQQFTYGLDNKYKGKLIEKNAKLDQYFDDYITDAGSWDFDKLSSHRALIDNIDEIVASVYRQGMSDGQRKVVQTAGNVSTDTAPQQSTQQNTSSKLEEQLRNAFGQGGGMTFKF
jgi:hypothetical protein